MSAMQESQPAHPPPAAATPSPFVWTAPWRRRILMRIGLQGKLILAFSLVLSIALGSICWIFVSQSNRRLEDIMGEQARQISYALALASKPSLEAHETGDLKQI